MVVARLVSLPPSVAVGSAGSSNCLTDDGNRSGFALIYDSRDSMNFEPRHRLVKKGLAAKVEKPSRKLRKERKNRAKSEWFLVPSFMIDSWLTTRPCLQRSAVSPRRRALETRRSNRPYLFFSYTSRCRGTHFFCIHHTHTTTTSPKTSRWEQAVLWLLLTLTLVP